MESADHYATAKSRGDDVAAVVHSPQATTNPHEAELLVTSVISGMSEITAAPLVAAPESSQSQQQHVQQLHPQHHRHVDFDAGSAQHHHQATIDDKIGSTTAAGGRQRRLLSGDMFMNNNTTASTSTSQTAATFQRAGPSFSASNMTVTSETPSTNTAAVAAVTAAAFGASPSSSGAALLLGESPSMASSSRSTSNLSSLGSMSSSQRGFSRGCNPFDRRTSISTLVVWLIALAAVVCASAAFVSVFFLFQNHMGDMLVSFTQETTSDVEYVVDRHFQRYRSMQRVTDKVLHNSDIVTDHVNYTAAIRWFARDVVENGMHMLLVRGLYTGYVIGPYSVFDAVDFPKRDNQVVVSLIANSTVTYGKFFDIGYFFLDTFEPVNQSHPFRRMYNLTAFNITNRPYFADISSGHVSWSQAYVAVLTRTSGVTIGARWGADVGAPLDSTYSIHDYTEQVAAYFKTLKISDTGVAMLIDVNTRAFVGGNIDDPSVVFLPNGTGILATMETLHAPLVRRVVAAAAANSGGIPAMNRLLTCASPCELVLCSDGLHELQNRRFTLFNEYTLVRVVSIQDDLGLNMRLMVILPASDFVRTVQTSATASMIAAGVVIAIVLVIVFACVHFAVKPLRNAAAFLYNTARLVSTPGRPLHLTLSTLQHRDVSRDRESRGAKLQGCPPDERHSHHSSLIQSCYACLPRIRQIDALNTSVHKLASELRTIAAFLPANSLPNSYSRHGSMAQSTSLEESAGVSITPRTDLMTGDGAPDNDSSNGSNGTPTPEGRGGQHSPQNYQHHQLHVSHRSDVSVSRFAPTVPPGSTGGAEDDVPAPLQQQQQQQQQHRSILENNGPRHHKSGGGGSAAAVVAPPSLYVLGTLWRVPVTTVVCNLVSFDGMRKLPQHHTHMSAIHQSYTDIILANAKQHGGSVEQLHGDRVWIYFNATKRVVGHAAAACRMMLSIEKQMKQKNLPMYNGVRLGASTGRALCGVMGPASLRVFTVVGEVVAQAMSLCIGVAIGGLEFPHRVLIGQRTSTLIQSCKDICARHVRLTFMPHEDSTTVVSVPVEVAHVKAQYPAAVASTSDVAMRRLLYFNTVYEHLAANETTHALALIGASRYVDDEWLLRQLCMLPPHSKESGGGGPPAAS